MCRANISGWHVPSLPGGRCRCGHEVPPMDVALLREQALELEARELRDRYRNGLAA